MNRCTILFAGAALALAPLIGSRSLSAAPPPSGGTIAIEARTEAGDDASTHALADAGAEAFTAKGFTVLNDPAHAAYTADLTLSRADIGTSLTKDPNAEKIGIGAGVMVPFSTGNSNIAALQRTRLDIAIRKRGDAGIVWRGAAVTVRTAGTRTGTNRAVALDLSKALLNAYPAPPREVIGVP